MAEGLKIVAVLLVLASCSYHVDKGGEDSMKEERPTSEMIARVSYADANLIFQSRCVACHGNSGGVNLETLAGARSALTKIWQSTILERRMPKEPMPALSQIERMKLWAWIEAGGPEFPANGGGSAPPPPPPLEPKFDSIKSHILEKKCIVCHSPGGKAERVPLLTRNDLVDSPLEIVIPGNADQSGIVLVLTPGARKPMPPLDSGMTPVKPEELEIIKNWINRGATE